ncbi:hypothetical protein AMJ87_03825 [candidate division WOR_3 bacterium SM23_60]|uniref:Flavodoxin-like domain-containing protein n=1 Tax=candidate division WOR_3 bacterium SM23_60 TaxID=1703780 RepID=A0A0S8GIX1_UNCW3|nr:MAG: hypothetical protein AMJ87_03825 [candidate division WOR_3 bacterium SM23_60]
MRVLKIVLIIIGAIVVILVVLFGIFLLINRQGVVEPFAVGNPTLDKRVLIASQGSSFKNTVVESLTTYLETKAYVKVIDVTSLAEVNDDEWDALVFIHTTEQWKLWPDVDEFLARAQNMNKVVLVTTSGSGDWKTDKYDVESITSASRMDEMPTLLPTLYTKLDGLLQEETTE